LGSVGFEIDSVQRLKPGIVERVIARKPDRSELGGAARTDV
jgi:hypothetical protein